MQPLRLLDPICFLLPTSLPVLQVFSGDRFEVRQRGAGPRRDLARAVFFAQADAASRAADEVLGRHRPAILRGPLPPGLEPGIMWRMASYRL